MSTLEPCCSELLKERASLDALLTTVRASLNERTNELQAARASLEERAVKIAALEQSESLMRAAKRHKETQLAVAVNEREKLHKELTQLRIRSTRRELDQRRESSENASDAKSSPATTRPASAAATTPRAPGSAGSASRSPLQTTDSNDSPQSSKAASGSSSGGASSSKRLSLGSAGATTAQRLREQLALYAERQQELEKHVQQLAAENRDLKTKFRAASTARVAAQNKLKAAAAGGE